MSNNNKNRKGSTTNNRAKSSQNCENWDGRNQKGGNGKRYGNKRSDKTYSGSKVASSPDVETATGGNHISWYVPDPNLLADVASVPFNYRIGDTLPIGTATSTTGVLVDGTWVEPGSCTIRFVPTYGDLVDSQSAGNIASTAVYSWVRHANSGSRNYDAVDLMLYLLAMDSIYAGITWCQRLISCIMGYSRDSVYPPRGWIESMGVSFNTSLIGDLPAMRARLNSMILKATTLAVPRTLPIYERHAFMCSNVYCDNTEQVTQYYVFNPDVLWKFQLESSESAKGMLAPVKFGTIGLTNEAGYATLSSSGAPWDQYFNVVEELINSLYGDEDAGIMSGDILKAYGTEGIFKLTTVPEDLVVVPIYDAEMLEQIHSAYAVGKFDLNNSTIKQDIPTTATSPYLVAALNFTNAGKLGLISRSRLLDLHLDVTPENIMRATRLCGPADTLNSAVSGYGTEIVTWISAIVWDPALGFRSYTVDSEPAWFTYDGTSYSPSPTQTYASMYLDTFFRAPILYPKVAFYSGSTTRDRQIPFGMTSKCTVLSSENLRQLNQVAILGCFNVPRLTLGYLENS